MFVVHAHITIDPTARAEFVVVMDGFVSETRAEPGNAAFELTGHLTDPGMFTLFECWESEDALRHHMEQAYFMDLVAIAPRLGFTLTGTTYWVERNHIERASETLERVRAKGESAATQELAVSAKSRP